jgi:hypothetical protein
VIIHVLEGLAQGCKCRISKPVSLLCLGLCCTVLRPRWCQSGVNITLVSAGTPSSTPSSFRSQRAGLTSCDFLASVYPTSHISHAGIVLGFVATSKRFSQGYCVSDATASTLGLGRRLPLQRPRSPYRERWRRLSGRRYPLGANSTCESMLEGCSRHEWSCALG